MKTGGWLCCGKRKLVVVFVLFQHDDIGEICICTVEKSFVSACLMLACVCVCCCPLACRFARWPARPLACWLLACWLGCPLARVTVVGCFCIVRLPVRVWSLSVGFGRCELTRLFFIVS